MHYMLLVYVSIEGEGSALSECYIHCTGSRDIMIMGETTPSLATHNTYIMNLRLFSTMEKCH